MIAFQRPKTNYIFTAILALICLNFSAAQFEIPEKPSLQTSLYDYADILSAAEEAALETKIINMHSISQQIVVNISTLMVKKLILGANWLSARGIGQKVGQRI